MTDYNPILARLGQASSMKPHLADGEVAPQPSTLPAPPAYDADNGLAYLNYVHQNPTAPRDNRSLVGALQAYKNFTQGGGVGAAMPTATPAAAAPAATATPAAAIPAYQPVEQMASVYGNSPEAWAAFHDQARAQTEGANRMPGVFSNTAQMPTDPAAANALLYQTNATGGNPLMDQLTQWLSSTKGK